MKKQKMYYFRCVVWWWCLLCCCVEKWGEGREGGGTVLERAQRVRLFRSAFVCSRRFFTFLMHSQGPSSSIRPLKAAASLPVEGEGEAMSVNQVGKSGSGGMVGHAAGCGLQSKLAAGCWFCE